jgi:L-iditol 2-dehydrogenase
MRAAVLYGKESVKVEDVPTAPLARGEVRIGIEAALTCGTDLKVFRRGYHARMIVPPAVFGHELAGVISEVGPEVEGWRVGDRVVVANSAPCDECFYCGADQHNLCDQLEFLNGAYAEAIVVPARLVSRNMLRLRPETSFRDAALVEPLACVVQGVRDTALRPRENVLVIGAGPIGLMFVALAREAGCEVTVAGRRRARLEAARRLGASRVLEAPAQGPLAPEVQRHCQTAFDAVIEAVGQPETWSAAVELVRKGGRVNFFGGCPANTSISLDTSVMHYRNLTLLASFHHTPRGIRRALELIERGVVRGVDFVDGECPLSRLPELFQQMAAGNQAVKTFIRVRE